MSRKDTKNAPAKNDDSIIEVMVVNNFLDSTDNDKFIEADHPYKTTKERAEHLVNLGYAKYIEDDNTSDDSNDNATTTNVDDANVVDDGTNVNDTSDANDEASNTDDATTTDAEDTNTNVDATTTDDESDTNDNPNADDPNVPNE